MVDIVVNPEWKSVRVLERDEVALGGVGGNMNEQATSLVARTELLKQGLDGKASIEELESSLTAIVGGHKAYQTLAAAQAAQASLPANTVVEVTNDPVSANNGAYQWNGTTLTKSAYDPLAQAKTYTDASLYAPYYAKDDFESGYLETFFDSYKTVNQYVPKRYSSGYASIAAGTSTKKIPLNTGLSIRFKIKYPASAPVMIFGLTDSSNGFVSANNIGIMTGESLTNAFHFRTPNSSTYPVASSLTKADAYNNEYSFELLIKGGTIQLVRYNSDFSSIVETFTQQVDQSTYKSYKYLTLYTQAATYFSLIEINYFNAKTVVETNKINPNYLDTASTYLLNDWSRRTATNAIPVASLGRDGQAFKVATIEIDIQVDSTNTTDGFLIGFGDAAAATNRIAVGYEPAAAYRGLVLFTGGVFTKIAPIETLTNGIYTIVLSKYDTRYRYQIKDSEGIIILDAELEDPLLNSQQLYSSGKYTTASKTVVKDVRFVGGEALPEKASQNSSGSGFKDLTGRNLVQEQFGGEGNDWSFVYTPENYSITGAPHGLVILNHGNGWTVSSDPATANFSSKTQFGVDTQNGGAYLDTNRPDYVQYSSPLIEALLAQGYVVCGATNYADNLYGNKNCRNAVADFYNYMRRNYNVKDRCHMVGASNGAMTTLNACHLLGTSKVASIALVYPLASLFDHYLAYSAHRDAIRSAYGVSANTYANLTDLKAEKVFFTHCPVHHYIVGDDLTEQQVKTLALPPMIVFSSTGDTVTAAASNGKKLKDLCDRSSLVCQYTDIDPTGSLGYNHGDWRHFNESEIVNFFLSNK